MPGIEHTAIWRLTFAAFLALGMSARGYHRGSLSWSGAAAALLVGFVSCASSVQFGLTLIIFFLSSSKVTRIGTKRKSEVEDGHQVGGNRNWVQVCANGGWGTMLAVAFWIKTAARALPPELPLHFAARPVESWIQAAYVSHYAACNADTWASELGVLSLSEPRLLTRPWKAVPPGTNGGITTAGTAASAAGGLLIGVTFWLLGMLMRPPEGNLPPAPPQWPIIVLGLLAGVLGSIIDSLLGATLQYSGWDDTKKKVVEVPDEGVKHISGFDALSNHQVNFLAAAATSTLGARACRMWLMA